LDRFESGDAGMTGDRWLGERGRGEAQERVWVAHVERDSDRICGIGSEELLDQRCQSGVATVVVESIPHRERHLALGPYDTADLAEGALRIDEVHQCELADGAVERVVGARQLFRETGLPLDVGSGLSGDGEHAVVRIDPGHVAVGSHANVCGAGQHTGAASHVEHAVPRADIGGIENDVGPLVEQGGHEQRLVHLGGAG
jgi:hypothetical protein